jgi:hypothetical protein
MNDLVRPAVMELEVINRNEGMPISDYFDGIPLEFPVNTPVTITPAQAMHLFGYPGELTDRALHMARRFGWSGRDFLIAQGEQEPRYVQLARNIEIRPVYYDLIRRDENAPIIADDGHEEEPAEGVIADTGTKVGRRKRTPARMGSVRSKPTRGR